MKIFISMYKSTPPLVQQIFLFLILGGVCYLVDILLLVGFVELMDMEVNLANLIASVISIYVAYVLNAKFIFKQGKHSITSEIAMFFLFSIIGLVFNIVLMYLFVTFVPISYVISKTIVTGLEAAFNFATRKIFVFQ